MVSDNEIRNKLLQIEDKNIQEACDLLRKSTRDVNSYLAQIVASVCDVDVKKMLTESSDINVVQARWLYWYAYRYFTQESHKNIADKYKYLRRFATSCVGIAIGKMTVLISQEPIWGKRWNVIKRVVKTMQSSFDFGNEQVGNITIKLTTPKGVKVELNEE